MPDSRTLWTAVVIICIAVSVFFSVKKRTTFKRLQQLMAAKQWDEFDRLLDGKLTSMLYPRYNRDYLRLNSYLLREDHKRAERDVRPAAGAQPAQNAARRPGDQGL